MLDTSFDRFGNKCPLSQAIVLTVDSSFIPERPTVKEQFKRTWREQGAGRGYVLFKFQTTRRIITGRQDRSCGKPSRTVAATIRPLRLHKTVAGLRLTLTP
ncbi:hypothetical protein KSP40_PGU018886 [Platanthera guangdongensis]|uniref:Transposase n=1 Tax=Platanthera guangdongensis TaxID=2320717 RepID=A0ABR2N5G7_9ASPA